MKKLTLLFLSCVISALAGFAQITNSNGGAWQTYTGPGATPPAGWMTNCGVGVFGVPQAGAPNAWQQTLFNGNYTPAAVPANYVWGPSTNPGGLDVTFYRMCFNVANPDCNTYNITWNADDQATIFVNGVQVGQNANWQATGSVDITANIICGPNVIAVQANELSSNFSPHFFIGQLNINPSRPFVISSEEDCEDHVLSLFASGPANANYQWSGPGGFMSNQQNPVIDPANSSNSGTYTCVMNDPTLPCCTGTLSIDVVMPDDCCDTLDFQTDFDVLTSCLDITVTDLSTVAGATINNPVFWNFGDNNTWYPAGAGASYNHTYASSGTYTVCLVVQVLPNDSTCCHDTICKEVKVSKGCDGIPDPEFTVTTNTFCSWNGCCIATTFINNSGITPSAVTWSWGDGNFSSGVSPNFGGWHDYQASGSFLVTMQVTYHPPCNPELCCTKTIQRWVRVSCLGWDDPKDDDHVKAKWGEDGSGTGITELNLYPNPTYAGSTITLELPENSSANEVTIFDPTGKAVMQMPVNGSDMLYINLPADLSSGLYILRTDDAMTEPVQFFVTE